MLRQLCLLERRCSFHNVMLSTCSHHPCHFRVKLLCIGTFNITNRLVLSSIDLIASVAAALDNPSGHERNGFSLAYLLCLATKRRVPKLVQRFPRTPRWRYWVVKARKSNSRYALKRCSTYYSFLSEDFLAHPHWQDDIISILLQVDAMLATGTLHRYGQTCTLCHLAHMTTNSTFIFRVQVGANKIPTHCQ